MIESTCTHKWNWQVNGKCPLCADELAIRHPIFSPQVMQSEITNEQLERITEISYTVDLPSRYIRMMAAELLRWRNLPKVET